MSGPQTFDLVDVDPFDLPAWLGESDVVWEPDLGVRTGHHVLGRLTSAGEDELPCDLLAVDEAYPVPVADDRARLHAHQAWRHGQILLVTVEGRLTMAVPGTSFSADVVLDALSRLAKAVGASTDRYAALLRIGSEKHRRSR
ncbi:hypothetical protein FB382_001687 [Nocardioides ginsengisegetis]|uniref:Uncharacterized protein n=1 Tax=Nocardioides ginsengisegetis TaxID=661491 RepID=A0A7W3P9F8_9ACTN|nr:MULTISPECIES: hypothetical protein [Nocardioides]MBA8803396.1 hypothetical protein [Nocardioides ginsengisegetis]GCD89038.1 hypothetical protein NLS1_10440 [Nocardioides sp. LS1]